MTNLDLQHSLPNSSILLPKLNDLIESLDDKDRKFILELWSSYIDFIQNEYINLYSANLSKSIEDVPELLRSRWSKVDLNKAPTTRPGTPILSELDVQWFDDSIGILIDKTVQARLNDSENTGIILDDFRDFLYIGSKSKFNKIDVDIAAGNEAVGSGKLTIQYFNGSSFSNLLGVNDETSSSGDTFAQNGNITFNLPSDWGGSADSVQSGLNKDLFYIRLAFSNSILVLANKLNADQVAPNIQTSETASSTIDEDISIILYLVENVISQTRRFERGVDYDISNGELRWFSDPINRFFGNQGDEILASDQLTQFSIADDEVITDVAVRFSPDPTTKQRVYLRSPAGTNVLAFSNFPEDSVNLNPIIGERSNGTWEIVSDGSYSGTVTVKLFKSSVLWGEFFFIDDNRLFDNFGALIDFKRISSELYKNQLLAVLSAFWNGPAIERLRQGVNALLALPHVTQNGKIDSASVNTSVISSFSNTSDITSDILSSSDSTSVVWDGIPAKTLYIGYVEKFSKIDIDLTTPSIGSSILIAEYFNGTKFIGLSDIIDNTESSSDSLSVNGKISFLIPGNWETGGGSENNSLPSDKFFIRLKPTTNPSTDPVVDKISLENDNGKLSSVAVVVKTNSGETVNVPDVLAKVTDESITFNKVTLDSSDVTVKVDKGSILSGTLIVTDSPETKTYTEDSDYKTDFKNGEIKILNGGTIDTDDISTILVDYYSLGPGVIVGSSINRFAPLGTAVTIEDRISDPAYLDDPIFDIAIDKFIESTTLTNSQVKELLKGNLFVVNIDTNVSDFLGPSGFKTEDIGKFVLSLKPAHTAFFIRFGDQLIGVDLSVISILDVTSIIGTDFDYTNRLKTETDFEDVQSKFKVYDGTSRTNTVTENVEKSGDGKVDGVWVSAVPLFIGSKVPFPKVNIDVISGATGSGALIADYFDGTSWSSLVVIYDETVSGGNSFAQDGQIKFDVPSDWDKSGPPSDNLDDDRYFARFTPTSTPSPNPVIDRIWSVDFETLSAIKKDEVIGTGNGALTLFPGTLIRNPLDRLSVLVTAVNINNVTMSLFDDGVGGFTGNVGGGTNTIDYSNGAISADFDTAVEGGEFVKVTYGDDARYEQFKLDDDTVSMTSDTLTKVDGEIDESLIKTTDVIDVTSYLNASFKTGNIIPIKVFNTDGNTDITNYILESDGNTKSVLLNSSTPLFIGYPKEFSKINVDVTTAGIGTGSLTAEYFGKTETTISPTTSKDTEIRRDQPDTNYESSESLSIYTDGPPINPTVNITGSNIIGDARIILSTPDANLGSSTSLSVQGRTPYLNRSVIKFNLQDIPFGSTILSASLSLYAYDKSTTSGDEVIDIHKLTSDWEESAITWNDKSSGVPWGTAGGDFSSPRSGFIQTGLVENEYKESSDISPLIQSWVNGSSANLGLIIKHNNELSSGNNWWSFRSRESLKQPILNVTYVITADKGIKARRALLHFDVSSIPVTATVTSAFLKVSRISATGQDISPRTHEIFRITSSDWITGTPPATWNSMNNEFSDQDGTLNAVFPGSDVITSTDLTSLAQEWVDGSLTNNGIMIIDSREGTVDDSVWEYGSRENSTFTLRPILEIGYEEDAGLKPLTTVVDGTKPASDTFAQDGQITFDIPTDWNLGGTSGLSLPSDRFFAKLSIGVTPSTVPVAEKLDVENTTTALKSKIRSIPKTLFGSYIFRMHNNFIDVLSEDLNITTNVIDDNDGLTQAVWDNSPAKPLYAGAKHTFSKIIIDFSSVASADTGSLVAEYWNGTTFSSLSIISDGTDDGNTFRKDGVIEFTIPANWEKDGPIITSLSEDRFYIKLTPSTSPATDPIIDKILVEDNFRTINNFSSDPRDTISELENFVEIPKESNMDVEWEDTSLTSLNDITSESRLIDSIKTGTIMDDVADFIYIGTNKRFSKILTKFETAASNAGALKVENFNGSSFVEIETVSDVTLIDGNTFSQDGEITFTIPDSWKIGANSFKAGLDVDLFYLRISFTNTPSTAPGINQLTPVFTGINEKFSWDDEGIILGDSVDIKVL